MRPQLAHRRNGPINTTLIAAPHNLSLPTNALLCSNLPQGTYPSVAVLLMPNRTLPLDDGAYGPAYPVYLRQLAYSLSALGGIRTH